MNDLTRTLSDLTRPLAPKPIAEPTLARRKAREIIDANPGATLVEIVAIAWLEGRVDGLREALDSKPFSFHDTADTCQRCGRKIRLGSSTPTPIPLDYVCFNCSAGDEPRAA